MRIRTIKPEFWTSDDIAKLDVETRLLFIGLWSYVDDNGVGRDEVHLIIAALFARDMFDNPRETVARVSRGLQTLSDGRLIHRYEMDGRAFLQVAAWEKHQRVDRPQKPRFPRYDANRDSLATPSRQSRDWNRGTEEQRNRGTEEQAPSSSLRSDEESHPPSGDSTTTDAEADRDDVNRVCEHMADSVHQRTGRRPNITRAWRTAARLMLDRDQRTEADIIAAINWSANDDFWRANILSLPALRRQYDRLSLQAARGRPRPSPLEITQPTTDAENAALVASIFTPTDLRTILAEETP
jgi:hypothetical protein